MRDTHPCSRFSRCGVATAPTLDKENVAPTSYPRCPVPIYPPKLVLCWCSTSDTRNGSPLRSYRAPKSDASHNATMAIVLSAGLRSGSTTRTHYPYCHVHLNSWTSQPTQNATHNPSFSTLPQTRCCSL